MIINYDDDDQIWWLKLTLTDDSTIIANRLTVRT